MNRKKTAKHQVVIVGAGPAGLGVGMALQTLGLDDFVILERSEIGNSFRNWPEEMRMITPSFNAHAFGYLDLNAIVPQTSPAYSLGVEHPSGQLYAAYLKALQWHFAVPVITGIEVKSLVPQSENGFTLITSQGEWQARFVIWAAGEFGHPRLPRIPGVELGIHNSYIRSWREFTEKYPGEQVVVIGGFESGIDAAIHLSALGKHVIVLDRHKIQLHSTQDPSTSLSPFTLERLSHAQQHGRIDLVSSVRVTAIRAQENGFLVIGSDEAHYFSEVVPILATGFRSSAVQIRQLFDWRQDGFPLLTDKDESTRTPGLFLVGPSVRQENIIFCFIYKFRQRFAVIAHEIGARLGMNTEPLEFYRQNQMFLDDLSCCENTCPC